MKRFNFLLISLRRQTVCNIAALSIVIGILFFTTVSCKKEEDDSEIFKTYAWVACGSSGCILTGTINVHGHLAPMTLIPVNLPRRYQRDGLRVRLTFQHIGYIDLLDPIIRVLTIEEVINTSRFLVREYRGCFLLIEEGREEPAPHQIHTRVAYNLPEKYRRDGLRVEITYRPLRDVRVCPLFYPYPSIFMNPHTIKIISIKETRGECAQTRILGGWEIGIEDNPWQVLLSRFCVSDRVWIPRCGGIIIAPNFILTAMHCVGNRETHIPFSANHIRIYAGITCRYQINSNNTFNVSRVILHPNRFVDAALLQLSRDIPFNHHQRAINYFASLNPALYNPGREVRVSGWGATATEPGSPLANCLRFADLTIISNADATHALQAPVRNHEVAARGSGPVRQGAYEGDSGGPLTTLSASGERVLIGIASRARPGYGNNENSPTVFERTDSLVPWILSAVSTISGLLLFAAMQPALLPFKTIFRPMQLSRGHPAPICNT